MNLYPSDYTTLDYIQNHRLSEAGDAADFSKASVLAFLTDAIRAASVYITEYTMTAFVPYTFTREYERRDLMSVYELALDTDLLAVSSITNGDGTVLTGSNYYLYPRTVWPKLLVETNVDNTYWVFTSFQSAISITGVWGYHTNYTEGWKARTTLGAAISDTTGTSVTVVSGAVIDTFGYIKVDDEMMRVTSISSNTLTVTRGVNGTTAATHANGATVSMWYPVSDVQLATTRLVMWLYDKRSTSGDTIALGDGTMVIPGVPPVIYKTLDVYRNRALARLVRSI